MRAVEIVREPSPPIKEVVIRLNAEQAYNLRDLLGRSDSRDLGMSGLRPVYEGLTSEFPWRPNRPGGVFR